MNLENKISVDSIVFLKEDTFKETLIKNRSNLGGNAQAKNRTGKV